jgi:hypothetical protein
MSVGVDTSKPSRAISAMRRSHDCNTVCLSSKSDYLTNLASVVAASQTFSKYRFDGGWCRSTAPGAVLRVEVSGSVARIARVIDEALQFARGESRLDAIDHVIQPVMGT